MSELMPFIIFVNIIDLSHAVIISLFWSSCPILNYKRLINPYMLRRVENSLYWWNVHLLKLFTFSKYPLEHEASDKITAKRSPPAADLLMMWGRRPNDSGTPGTTRAPSLMTAATASPSVEELSPRSRKWAPLVSMEVTLLSRCPRLRVP